MTEVVRDSVVINAGVDTIMDVIGDFEAYPEWQPQIEAVEILETDADGWATRVRFVVDAKITKADLTLDYTYTDTTMAWTLVASNGVKRNDGSYTLTDVGDGTTRVDYTLEIDPGIPVPGIIRRQAAKQIVDTALKGLKRRVESG